MQSTRKSAAIPSVATIVIDMLDPSDHEDSAPLAAHVHTRIDPLQKLIAATADARAELVYVIETVVLAGQVTVQSILYSALEAYVRGFSVRVASDAVAPIDPDLGGWRRSGRW